MTKALQNKLLKIIKRVKECRGKDNMSYEEYVCIIWTFGEHSNKRITDRLEVYFLNGLSNTNRACTFTFDTLEDMEDFLEDKIEGYVRVGRKTTSKSN